MEIKIIGLIKSLKCVRLYINSTSGVWTDFQTRKVHDMNKLGKIFAYDAIGVFPKR